MAKKLTIRVADDVYEGLYRKVGPRRIGKFLEDLARPHVVVSDLAAEYREAAQDEEAEREARDWLEASVADGLPGDELFDAPR